MKLEKKLKKQYKFEAPDNLDSIKESLGLNHTYTQYVKHKSPLIMFTSVVSVSAIALALTATFMVKGKNDESADLPADNDKIIFVQDKKEHLDNVIPSSQLSLIINSTLGEEKINVLEYMPKYLDTESYNVFKDAEEKSKCMNNVFNNLNAIINNANDLNDATDGTYIIPANNYEFTVIIKNNKAKIKTNIDNIYYEMFTEESNDLVYYDVVIKEEKTEISYKYRENDIQIISREYSSFLHSDKTYVKGYELRKNDDDIKITLNGKNNNKINTIQFSKKIEADNSVTYRIDDESYVYVFKDGLIAYYSDDEYYAITDNTNTFKVSYYNDGVIDYKMLHKCADKVEFKTYFLYSI